MDKIKKLLLGAVALLGALFLWERNKRKLSEVQLENIEDKEKLLKIDEEIHQKENKVDLEKEKREQIEIQATKEKEKDVSKEEMESFFNKPNTD